MTITRVYGACPHDCPDTCGIITEVEDGRAINFYADPAHPTTDGWLCAKVRPYLEHVYHPERLTHPLRRVGPKGGGRWQRLTWDDAVAEIAERWQGIIARYGAEAILPYSYSGTLGMVQMGIASSRLWNRLGASRLERAICGAAAELAVEATLGVRLSQPYADVSRSKLVIIWGHNPASTAPHFMPHLKAAQRNGTQLIVIDPRRTRTAKGADWHLAPLPNSDGALALGLAHVIVAEGWHSEDWLREHTVGWPQLRERLADFPPERVARLTGLPAADIIELARRYAGTRPALIKIADGLQRHLNGGQTVRSILTLPALTGQYGLPGGGLAYSTSGAVKWDSEVMGKWSQCPPRRARSINMNRLGAALTGEATDPPVMSLVVFGSNPAAIAPNAGKVVEGLRREDLFTVVHDLFLTDTADFADIVLPATSQLEHADLHKAYGHTRLAYNAPAIPPLGESKSSWDAQRLLAAALGFTEPWLRQDADEIIDEMLAAMAAKNPAFAGITPERLRAEHSLPLKLESDTPFAGGRFPTPSGKVELYCERLAQMGLDPLPGWAARQDEVSPPPGIEPGSAPLTLISGAAHHFVTSSFGGQASLLRREGEPFVEIHPADAAARGIADGALVVVENGRGWCRLRAVVTEAVRPGVLASPKGRWAKNDPFANGDGGRNINWTTPDALADMAGQSTFHSNRVWVRAC
ncbi:MAG: molybdopterin oxidoreductase family protein [Anaerolineae bacterium]